MENGRNAGIPGGDLVVFRQSGSMKNYVKDLTDTMIPAWLYYNHENSWENIK